MDVVMLRAMVNAGRDLGVVIKQVILEVTALKLRVESLVKSHEAPGKVIK